MRYIHRFAMEPTQEEIAAVAERQRAGGFDSKEAQRAEDGGNWINGSVVEALLRRGGGFLSFPQGEIGAATYVSNVGTAGFKWSGFQKLYGPGATPAGSGRWELSPTIPAVQARPAFLS